jgi:hypothetical protein
MLINAQPAGDDSLPCVSPCVLMLILPPANDFESPNPVQRKNFMFSMAPNIVLMAVIGTPNA